MEEKFSLVTENSEDLITPDSSADISMSNQFEAKENTTFLNIVFILGFSEGAPPFSSKGGAKSASPAGFFLGDGCAYIRIRDNVTGLLFIPKFEIKQKNTTSNLYLMELICNFLISKGVQACLRTDSYYVLCVIEGVENISNLLLLLEPHYELFFWKTNKLKMVQQFVKLITLDSRNLLPVKYLIIKTIYSIENNRDYTMKHWLNRIDEIFNQKSVRNTSGEFYISPVIDKVNKTGKVTKWCVHLPLFLKSSPRSKYFSFEKYGGQDIAAPLSRRPPPLHPTTTRVVVGRRGGSLEREGGCTPSLFERGAALKEAIAYRDSVVNRWYTDQGYVADPLIVGSET
uniref:LAGLIDADG endonuclease n=1 Tax=Morchella brunnea TaxID=1174671 RepID=A0A8K1I7W2_9PEZI|nr:LAGLIDADG endonuclease [Morchella brunnea]UBU98511.1 LAGLIDADG endonuclease [Morchella brunnea]